MPTLWNLEQANEQRELEIQHQILKSSQPQSTEYQTAEAKILYIEEKRQWLNEQASKVKWMALPLLSHFHWEDDAGGSQALNQVVSWWDLTRINRKDLLAALIFGIRISLSVGIIAVGIALLLEFP